MTDIAVSASEERVNVACDIPRTVLEQIDRKASLELLSRRAWLRRALLRASREPEAA